MKTNPFRRAFSLVELMVALGVISIAMGLMLPAIQSVRGAAARLGCLNNLHQIGLAFHSHHQREGSFPGDSPNNKFLLSWLVDILPDMGQENLFKATVEAKNSNVPGFRNPPHIGLSTVIKPYVCSADNRLFAVLEDSDKIHAAYTSYIGVVAKQRGDSVLGGDPPNRTTDITDGLSNTIAVGERPPPSTLQAGKWYTMTITGSSFGNHYGPNGYLYASRPIYPGDSCHLPKSLGPGRIENPCDRYHYWSLHGGGANFLFADGSVRFLTYSLDNQVFMSLSTKNGNETLPSGW